MRPDDGGERRRDRADPPARRAAAARRRGHLREPVVRRRARRAAVHPRPERMREIDPAAPDRRPRTAGSGEITVAGEPPAKAWEQIAYVFQSPRLVPWRTALGNVTLARELRFGGKVDAAARERAAASARDGRAQTRHAQVSPHAVGRRAPACRDRAGAGGRAGDHPDGRAARGARHQHAPAAAPGNPRRLAADGQDHRVRHPRHRRRVDAGRPRAGPVAQAARIVETRDDQGVATARDRRRRSARRASGPC